MYRFHFKLTDMVMLHLIPIIEGSYINTIYLHNYEFKLVCVCVCAVRVLCDPVSFIKSAKGGCYQPLFPICSKNDSSS